MFLNVELLEKVLSLPISQFEGNRRLAFSFLIKFYHLHLLVFTFDSFGKFLEVANRPLKYFYFSRYRILGSKYFG